MLATFEELEDVPVMMLDTSKPDGKRQHPLLGWNKFLWK
jgi:hypothetical protein